MASDKKKAAGKKQIEPSDAIKNHLQERPSKKKPEYLVRGALLHCRCGSYARRLNLSKDHAIYMTEHPVIHELNCICGEGENITPFGVCKSSTPPETEIITCAKDVPRGPNGEPIGPAPGGVDIGKKCSPVIVGMKWKNSYGKSRIVDNGEHNPSDRAISSSGKRTPKGEAAVTTVSFLVCQFGGLIEPYTSGQEYDDSNLTQDEFLKNIQEQFGFDSKTAQIMWDVYTKLKEKYPNDSQSEIDWRFTRLLGGFSYSDTFKGEIMWDSTAGCAIDQKKDWMSGSGNHIAYQKLSEEEYFSDFLGISEKDYLLLRYKVRIQNQISSSPDTFRLPEKFGSLSEGQLENFNTWKSTCESATGINFANNQAFLNYWNNQYNNFCDKADFAHQQITTAAILATPLHKDGFLTDVRFLWDDQKREDMAGWLGDATLKGGGKFPFTEGKISFGVEDYMADLDAVNISNLMDKEGLSYFEASNAYYRRLEQGASRADIFLKNTDLTTVKKKIYSELVYPDIRGQMNAAAAARNIGKLNELSRLYNDDAALLEMVKKQSPDTYNFIKSLENGNHQMGNYYEE